MSENAFRKITNEACLVSKDFAQLIFIFFKQITRSENLLTTKIESAISQLNNANIFFILNDKIFT